MNNNNETTDAEIIEFFRMNDFQYEDENDDWEEKEVKSLDDCREALSQQLQWAVGEDKRIIRSYYGALYRQDEVSGSNFGEYITLFHRAAELLGTSVKPSSMRSIPNGSGKTPDPPTRKAPANGRGFRFA